MSELPKAAGVDRPKMSLSVKVAQVKVEKEDIEWGLCSMIQNSVKKGELKT